MLHENCQVFVVDNKQIIYNTNRVAYSFIYCYVGIRINEDLFAFNLNMLIFKPVVRFGFFYKIIIL